MNKDEIPEDLRLSAKEYVDLLAKSISNLQVLAIGLSGGFEQAKEEVKLLVEKGVPFPEAIYIVSNNILNGKMK